MYNFLVDGFFMRGDYFLLILGFFWLPCVVLGVLVPQPGIEETQPGIPPAVDAWTPHH